SLEKVQLIGGLDYRTSIEVYPIFLPQGREHLMALVGLTRSEARFRVPEVGDDPHTKQVITEVAERRTPVDRTPIGRKSPILPERRSRDAGHGKTWHTSIAHRAARRPCKDSIHKLLWRCISFKCTHDIGHLDTALIGDARKEVLIEQERDDGDELRRRTSAIIYVSSGRRQDAHIVAIGISIRVVDHPIHLAVTSRRPRLPEKPESPCSRCVEVPHVNAVRGVKCVVEI